MGSYGSFGLDMGLGFLFMYDEMILCPLLDDGVSGNNEFMIMMKETSTGGDFLSNLLLSHVF